MHSIFFLHLFPLLVIRPHFKWSMELNAGTYFNNMHQSELPCFQFKRHEILKRYGACVALLMSLANMQTQHVTPQVSALKIINWSRNGTCRGEQVWHILNHVWHQVTQNKYDQGWPCQSFGSHWEWPRLVVVWHQGCHDRRKRLPF